MLLSGLAAVAAPSRGRATLVLLNAQWRGGSTLAEQLIFENTLLPPFLLDEPAMARWDDNKGHSVAAANLGALQCDFELFNTSHLLVWEHWRGVYTRQLRRAPVFTQCAHLPGQLKG